MSNVIRASKENIHITTPRLIIIALFTLVGVACSVAYLKYKMLGPSTCLKGQLETINECIADESYFISWDKGGWWYGHAKGKMSKEACDKVGLDIKEFEIVQYKDPIKMTKMDCSRAGFVSAKYCYGRQWPTTGGTQVAMMAANDCTNAEYFTGLRATLKNGKPTIPTGKHVRLLGIPASDGK